MFYPAHDGIGNWPIMLIDSGLHEEDLFTTILSNLERGKPPPAGMVKDCYQLFKVRKMSSKPGSMHACSFFQLELKLKSPISIELLNNFRIGKDISI
jgi:hypothetical protein